MNRRDSKENRRDSEENRLDNENYRNIVTELANVLQCDESEVNEQVRIKKLALKIIAEEAKAVKSRNKEISSENTRLKALRLSDKMIIDSYSLDSVSIFSPNALRKDKIKSVDLCRINFRIAQGIAQGFDCCFEFIHKEDIDKFPADYKVEEIENKNGLIEVKISWAEV